MLRSFELTCVVDAAPARISPAAVVEVANHRSCIRLLASSCLVTCAHRERTFTMGAKDCCRLVVGH